jgi:drug efflux transport system permease protein
MMQPIPSEELKKGRSRRLKALMIKEFLQIVRDPSSIMISVVLPFFLLFLYGFGISLDINHLRMGVAIEDTASDAEDFLASMMGSRYFDVTVARDRRELLDPLTKGDIRGYVVIPSYFSEFRKRPATIAPIQVITDGSEPNTANFVKIYTEGAFQNWHEQGVINRQVPKLTHAVTDPRFWYNEQLESRYFILTGALAIIMTLIGTLLTALVVAREWERGTMESLMSTPVGIKELVVGKLIPYFLLGMISMVICIFVVTVLFRIPFRGSFWLLILLSSAFLFSALGLGLMVSTMAKNQIVAYQVALITGFLPAYILSGFLFDIASMPLPIRFMTYLLPARYFVQCLQTIFLVGNVWRLLLMDMIPMIVIGLIFFLITARRTVKRLD